jgi:hypothetical protein
MKTYNNKNTQQKTHNKKHTTKNKNVTFSTKADWD